jgi:predicted lipoprotein with Yx(FWY)xxD motif
MKTRAATTLALALLGTALALAGGAAAARHTAHGHAVVKLGATSLGKVLVAANGRTLYLYTPDSKSKSTCYGGCASAWPPLLSTGKPKAARGVQAKLLGVTMRSDGSHQVTYKGHPLYLYAGDSKAGDVTGEGVGDVWYAVSAKGADVEPKTSGTADEGATTTSGGSGSGYGA